MGFRNPILRLSQLIADTVEGATIIGGTIKAALIEVGNNITIDPTNGIEIHYTDPTTGNPAVLQLPTNGTAPTIPGNLLDATTQANIATGVAAQRTANGKNTVNYNTVAPTAASPGIPGDLWFVLTGTPAEITAQYFCTAGTDTTSGNTWQSVQITNTVIANLDAGKITTGTLSAITVLGALIETAATGMRMWMQAQSGNNFEGLFLSTGLASEQAPAEVGMWWNTPTGAPPNPTTTSAGVSITSPNFGTKQSTLTLGSPVTGMGGIATAELTADEIFLAALTNITALVMKSATQLNGFDFGTVTSQTTDASGQTIVPHGLGVVPKCVIAVPFLATSGREVRLAAMASNQFNLTWYTTTTGAVLANTNVGFCWLALC